MFFQSHLTIYFIEFPWGWNIRTCIVFVKERERKRGRKEGRKEGREGGRKEKKEGRKKEKSDKITNC